MQRYVWRLVALLAVLPLAWAACAQPTGDPLALRWTVHVSGTNLDRFLAELGANPAHLAIVAGDLGTPGEEVRSLQLDNQPLRVIFDCAAAVLGASWRRVGRTIVFTPLPPVAGRGADRLGALGDAVRLTMLLQTPGAAPLLTGRPVPVRTLSPVQTALLGGLWQRAGTPLPRSESVSLGYGVRLEVGHQGAPTGDLVLAGPALEVVR